MSEINKLEKSNDLTDEKPLFSDLDGQQSRHQRHHEELKGSADDPTRRCHLSRQSRMCKIHSTSRRSSGQQTDGQNCVEESSFHVRKNS